MYQDQPDQPVSNRDKSGLRFSIVICTDGRAAALANTLRCLQFLDGPRYEVCVVRGPTEDGVTKVLAQWSGRIKVARNPERNLSVSRNLGIGLAAGEIVAFLDDDGLPEPQWLVQLARAFAEPRVAGSGGIVMDHTGARPQYLYSSADRLANADWQRKVPASEYNFPYSFNVPYLQGTNSAFRREALLDIKGFDEEYEFYLDETDVCCRLVDAGWELRQLPDAVVHHKFLPSAIRTADRVTRVRYAVLKNKLYFSLINNRGHFTVKRAVDDMFSFAQAHEADLRAHVEAGRLSPADLALFRADEHRAWEVGLKRGLSGERRLMDPKLPALVGSPFLEFPRLAPPGGRDTFVFISQEYPPGPLGGVGRYVHQLARAISDLGHCVHVLTRGKGHDRVDFEDGVWVHRVAPRESAVPPPPGIVIPAHIWAHSALMLAELRQLAERQRIDAVYAPIWDCEGAAVLFDGAFPLVTGLQTTLRFWLESHRHHTEDAVFMRDFAKPMLALEARLLNGSDGIHAISSAIRRDISAAHHITLKDARTSMVPLGLEDFSELPEILPEPPPEGVIRALFVGRLEARKGIDILLEVIPGLLTRHPSLHFDIVGNDRIPGPDGLTYRAAFEAMAAADVRARTTFHGEVSEDHLRGFYHACDFFVAPSRYESFGQVLLEAMAYAKPVVACRAGGMVEIAEHESTALLANPGDAASLEQCLERLVVDPSLRQSLGAAGRGRYESRFSPGAMAEGVVALLRRARDAKTGQPEQAGGLKDAS